MPTGAHLVKSCTKAKNRKYDIYYTPLKLAKEIIDIVPLAENDTVLDPFRGKGAFYDQYPENVNKLWCEISDGRDFFEFNEEVDWIISNPPFSKLNDVLEHTLNVCKKGFCYIMGVLNLTNNRVKYIKNHGFNLTFLEIANVREWHLFSCCVVIFQKDVPSIKKLAYDAY